MVGYGSAPSYVRAPEVAVPAPTVQQRECMDEYAELASAQLRATRRGGARAFCRTVAGNGPCDMSLRSRRALD
jgi:hypothetical protein